MRLDLLLYALPLFLSGTLGAPFPDTVSAALVAPSPAVDTLTLVPIDTRSIHKRSGRGGKFNLAGGGRKKKDGSDAGPSNNNGGGSSKPKPKPKPDPAKKAEAISSTQNKSHQSKSNAAAAKKESEDASANLSPEAKAEADTKVAALKTPRDRNDADRKNKNTDDEDEAAQKKKDEEDGVTAPKLEIESVDLIVAWERFQNAPGGKGTDGLGWVHAEKIAEAFRNCKKMGPDKYLFWSAGIGTINKAWEKAVIPAYAKATGRYKIADAAKFCSKVRSLGLGGMGGRGDELARLAADAARDRMMATPGKTPISKKTKQPVAPRKPTADELKKANNDMMYRFYWAVMSRGYAMAAEGSVEWLHPEGITMRPDMHWHAIELPEVRKNVGDGARQVTAIREVTFPLDSVKPPFDFTAENGLIVTEVH
ncbi:hypothetical protein EDC01DRAFT_650221 [Geopyxis carbonaria]|nr:hypothetical protein EDC01DRAFT_650221 [Geopyxis carbonaria]